MKEMVQRYKSQKNAMRDKSNGRVERLGYLKEENE